MGVAALNEASINRQGRHASKVAEELILAEEQVSAPLPTSFSSSGPPHP
jgi:hypothetical protein